MEIRGLSIADHDQVLRVWEEAGLPGRPEGRDSRERMAEQMLRDGDLFLGAFKGERMVGVVLGTYDGRKGYINRLAVVPATRGVGIAKALLKECEAALRKRGAEVICTLIEVPNRASVEFFKKAGYVEHEDIVYLSKRDRPEA